MLNKSSLGSKILNNEKGKNETITNNTVTLNQFCVILNKAKKEPMIAFTVNEYPELYFWASATLYQFLSENVENADYDEETMTYSFPDDEVKITFLGKTAQKNDPTLTVNRWKIDC